MKLFKKFIDDDISKYDFDNDNEIINFVLDINPMTYSCIALPDIFMTKKFLDYLDKIPHGLGFNMHFHHLSLNKFEAKLNGRDIEIKLNHEDFKKIYVVNLDNLTIKISDPTFFMLIMKIPELIKYPIINMNNENHRNNLFKLLSNPEGTGEKIYNNLSAYYKNNQELSQYVYRFYPNLPRIDSYSTINYCKYKDLNINLRKNPFMILLEFIKGDMPKNIPYNTLVENEQLLSSLIAKGYCGKLYEYYPEIFFEDKYFKIVVDCEIDGSIVKKILNEHYNEISHKAKAYFLENINSHAAYNLINSHEFCDDLILDGFIIELMIEFVDEKKLFENFICGKFVVDYVSNHKDLYRDFPVTNEMKMSNIKIIELLFSFDDSLVEDFYEKNIINGIVLHNINVRNPSLLKKSIKLNEGVFKTVGISDFPSDQLVLARYSVSKDFKVIINNEFIRGFKLINILKNVKKLRFPESLIKFSFTSQLY